MKIKKIKSLKTFGISGTVAVAVAFLVFALLPATVEGFTLIELQIGQVITGVFDSGGYPCNREAALAWDNYIKDHLAVGDFTVGFRVPDLDDPPGIFFRLTPAPKSVFLYTYGNNGVNPPIKATMGIRLEDLKKLPHWLGLVADTKHAQVSMLYGRWDVMRGSGPIGGFPGDLRFDIGNVTVRVQDPPQQCPFCQVNPEDVSCEPGFCDGGANPNEPGCDGTQVPCPPTFSLSSEVRVVCVVPEYRN